MGVRSPSFERSQHTLQENSSINVKVDYTNENVKGVNRGMWNEAYQSKADMLICQMFGSVSKKRLCKGQWLCHTGMNMNTDFNERKISFELF